MRKGSQVKRQAWETLHLASVVAVVVGCRIQFSETTFPQQRNLTLGMTQRAADYRAPEKTLSSKPLGLSTAWCLLALLPKPYFPSSKLLGLSTAWYLSALWRKTYFHHSKQQGQSTAACQ
jgi:hypothetical protein